ncbi:MAG: hypothetical protein K6L81_02140 [Agarilytica sp.]
MMIRIRFLSVLRNHLLHVLISVYSITLAQLSYAEDKIELETTIIKGNTELPKILYVVPWQDVTDDKKSQQKLTLHSLFGDIFEPVTPDAPSHLEP